MLKYTNQNVTLLVTDKQYSNIEKYYNMVAGKIETISINGVIDYLLTIVNKKYKKMQEGEYLVKIYSERSGYAKSCKWSKNCVICDFIVRFENSSKFRIKKFTFERTKLYSGEFCDDKIFTNDFKSRDYQLQLLTNYNNCINLPNVQNFEIRLENERRIYNNFVSLMNNFAI